MDSKPDRWKPTAILIAATAASAALWWLGSGVHPMWWATWLAPLPVLTCALRASRLAAVIAAFAAWSLGGLNVWSYSRDLLHLPLGVILIVICAPALVFALATLLARALTQRGRIITAALAVPSFWVSVEYVSSVLSPHGTFSNIAYTQMDALPVIQIAALCGVWGIGFLVLLLPATFAAISAPQATRTQRTQLAAMTGSVLMLALGYGGWRLHSAAFESTTAMRIGLVSVAGPVRAPLDDAAGQYLLQRYLRAIDRLADDGAQSIVMPETVFATSAPDIPALADAARRRHLTLIAGVDYRVGSNRENNMALVFRPDGNAPATYVKHHLLPLFEARYTPGDDYTVWSPSNAAPRAGIAICKDMDFQALGRANAGLGARLLYVPAWDFDDDGWLHSRMAILRGVESGFAIARSARDGQLTLSDDRGRVVAETSSSHVDDAAMVAMLPVRSTRTLYMHIGDAFAWLALAFTGVAILRLAIRPRRNTPMA